MQVGYENIVILDEYLVDHCWTVACDQHLEGLADRLTPQIGLW